MTPVDVRVDRLAREGCGSGMVARLVPPPDQLLNGVSVPRIGSLLKEALGGGHVPGLRSQHCEIA
ncbi:hypothetical protein STRTUCAR8_09211 [Streptomyces turgidiscabies Car8]|uniref:Uncharacterized protein n=1 Tax=Streptomyces turgidiscabies (strain Car8) TaxID=698760 RepID=L7F022_STRT8|nr:hypothetical protein STRTUCAR8_09211 [Streptomyces turgidiscabies Car8]